jgi:endonuclease/exonuclease/phosphatase family metal-dependent hydrolase
VALAVLASVVAPGQSAVAARPDSTPAPAAERFWELQLNLCNSGIAGCYAQGRSIPEAAELISRVRPNLVTLNEICANDVPDRLAPSLAQAWPGDRIYYVFNAAVRRDTGSPVKCNNGQDYGNAVLGRVPAATYQGVNAWRGTYTTQDSGNEQRTYACAYAVGDHLACATHLSASSEPVALAQCRALLFDVVPHIRSVETVTGKTVVGGDFNLEYDTSDPENAQNCVPSGHVRKGDGDVQHVVFSNDIAFVSTAKYGLRHTDHDGFLVRLTKP